jgi:hypothetical protein
VNSANASWRKGEIISLKWTGVDRHTGAIRLRAEAAKTGRGRTVVLEGDLAALIERRYAARLFDQDGKIRLADLVFHRGCSTTCVAPLPGTWCARVSRSASRWR